MGQGDYSEAVTTLLGAKGAQQKKMYVLPSCEEPPCKSISGTDLIFSGLSDDTRKTQYDKTDSNGHQTLMDLVVKQIYYRHWA